MSKVNIDSYGLKQAKHECKVLEGYEVWSDEKHCSICGAQLK
jgi:hypothetical protein